MVWFNIVGVGDRFNAHEVWIWAKFWFMTFGLGMGLIRVKLRSSEFQVVLLWIGPARIWVNFSFKSPIDFMLFTNWN